MNESFCNHHDIQDPVSNLTENCCVGTIIVYGRFAIKTFTFYLSFIKERIHWFPSHTKDFKPTFHHSTSVPGQYTHIALNREEDVIKVTLDSV